MTPNKDKVYIVGHIKPDLDSIACALGYQAYMNSIGYFNYYAIRCDKVNTLTEWIFKKFDTRLPEYIPDISGMNVVLADHTYPESRPKGWEKANILEVIDHHDVKLEDIIPQKIHIRECGATASLISEMFLNSNIPIPKNISGILLGAILDDTLNLESPTTTTLDTNMVYSLFDISDISNLESFAEEIFSKKDSWSSMSSKEILNTDMKEVSINGNRVVISQIETLNSSDIDEESILTELKDMNTKDPLNLRIAMLTDIKKNQCKLLIVGKDIPMLEIALGESIIDNRLLLPNVVSRKKQILPILKEMYC